MIAGTLYRDPRMLLFIFLKSRISDYVLPPPDFIFGATPKHTHRMKKFLKAVGIILLVLIAGWFVAAAFLPAQVTTTRTTTINAPKETVFAQMVHFKQWPNWSPWYEMDTTVVMSYHGTDGQPGSSYDWTSKKTGTGTMTNKGVNGTAADFEVHFIEPFETSAPCQLLAEDAGAGQTKASWTMTMDYKFAMRPMQLFYSVNKDFDRGLQKMKEYCEKNPAAVTAQAAL